MHIKQILKNHKIAFSFEVFPPKTKATADQLFTTINDMVSLKLAYVSVTYGAGGSTRNLTHELLVRIKQETDLPVVSHLTCVGATRNEIRSILETYDQSGIKNILALRGDPPKGETDFAPVVGGFSYAVELVAFIKKYFPQMGVGVAGYPEGHPETPNRLKEIDYLKAKVDAGADYICTQLFFDNRDFYDFCERCEIAGIIIPVIAGITTMTSDKLMRRMSEFAAGTRIPARLMRALSRTNSDKGFEEVGIHWAAEQVRDLIDHGVKGIHLYSLNRSHTSRRIFETLGVENTKSLSE